MMASPKRSWLISALVHAAVFAALVLTGKVTQLLPPMVDHGSIVLPSDLVKYQVTRNEPSGGSGGQHDPGPARRGDLPKTSTHPFVPPTTHVENEHPVLSMDMAILGQPAVLIPVIDLIGDPNGPLGAIGGGPGGPNGIGNGRGHGIGNGRGAGAGDGDDGGVRGYRGSIGDAVSQPSLLSKVEPEYSEEARKVKLQGSVFLRIVVDERGYAESIEVTQGLGLGLDERAIEAVRKWRFKAGMRGGRPVPTSAIIQVTFRLL